MIEKPNNSRAYRWGELFNNDKGKTTIALVVAFLICLCGCVAFLFCVWFKRPYLTECTCLVALGTSIFGARTFKRGA